MKPNRWALRRGPDGCGLVAKQGLKQQAPLPSPMSKASPVWCSEKPGRADLVSASAAPGAGRVAVVQGHLRLIGPVAAQQGHHDAGGGRGGEHRVPPRRPARPAAGRPLRRHRGRRRDAPGPRVRRCAGPAALCLLTSTQGLAGSVRENCCLRACTGAGASTDGPAGAAAASAAGPAEAADAEPVAWRRWTRLGRCRDRAVPAGEAGVPVAVAAEARSPAGRGTGRQQGQRRAAAAAAWPRPRLRGSPVICYVFRNSIRRIEWSASLVRTSCARPRVGRTFSTRLGSLIRFQMSSAVSSASASESAA